MNFLSGPEVLKRPIPEVGAIVLERCLAISVSPLKSTEHRETAVKRAQRLRKFIKAVPKDKKDQNHKVT